MDQSSGQRSCRIEHQPVVHQTAAQEIAQWPDHLVASQRKLD
jgi:hypothetical protein